MGYLSAKAASGQGRFARSAPYRTPERGIDLAVAAHPGKGEVKTDDDTSTSLRIRRREENRAEPDVHFRTDPRRRTFARTRHIEHLDPVCYEPFPHGR